MPGIDCQYSAALVGLVAIVEFVAAVDLAFVADDFATAEMQVVVVAAEAVEQQPVAVVEAAESVV